ncbi:MAG: TRAP transporter small permease [Deltaproteobacteria bacterium]|nr:TRAP transporter small permease [Candidatus Anaeroferrophillacea bacterium]
MSLIKLLVRWFNYGAALCVVLMMGLTCADVIGRLFRHPILGTYEMVGLLGALAIALALPSTTLEKGHVAVDFLVEKCPSHLRRLIDILMSLLGAVLFALIAWQSLLYADGLRETGEVTLSCQLPFWPVVDAIAVSALLVSVVLLAESLPAARNGASG